MYNNSFCSVSKGNLSSCSLWGEVTNVRHICNYGSVASFILVSQNSRSKGVMICILSTANFEVKGDFIVPKVVSSLKYYK